jgi:predicted ATP-grasp superfamily ATP-dependent carboligase
MPEVAAAEKADSPAAVATIIGMAAGEPLLIFGASARAAAFSALRADLRPWCADLFGDRDLRARSCFAFRAQADLYPDCFSDLSRQAPPGPWMYTGALENRRGLVRTLAQARPLWGNGVDVLRKVRSPHFLFQLFRDADISSPRCYRRAEGVPHDGSWLAKPLAGAGGTGIRFSDGKQVADSKRHYFQEYVEGDPFAAVYLGDGREARLLGITRQLVGETWLHAAPFHYCGSVGPLDLPRGVCRSLARIGSVLARGCGLRGLFGVDGVLRDGIPWPVEVNPRYTASVEVLEYARGIPALALHRGVFDAAAPRPKMSTTDRPAAVIGKAILFAKAALVFPPAGPWQTVLEQPGDIGEMPEYADIPAAGERIPVGGPILTLFARAASVAACLNQLRRQAANLDHMFFESGRG